MSFLSIFSRGKLDGESNELDTDNSGTPTSDQPEGETPSSDDNSGTGQDGTGSGGTGQDASLQTGHAMVTTDGGDTTPPPAATPTYLSTWDDGRSFMEHAQGSQYTPLQLFQDRNKWAAATGNTPTDIMDFYAAIEGKDANKSLRQQAADEKKARRQERWQQAANILHHIGNFVGTLYGAPSQHVENMTELTARQQKIREAAVQQRNAYNQNLLAQIYKDRADQRAAEKNTADIGLIQQRIEALQNDDERKKAKNDADIALAGARQQQAEQQAQLNEERAETERQLRDPRVANMKASTNAHNASAQASRARAAASNTSAYGNNYRANRYRIWASNKRKHPNDFRQFMEDNNIHSWDRRNWTSELIDQFNGWIADKYENQSGGGGGGAADLLD